MHVWTPTGPRKVGVKETWTKQCLGCLERGKAWRAKMPKHLTDKYPHAGLQSPFIPDEWDVCEQCVLAQAGLLNEGRHDACDSEGVGELHYDEPLVVKALRDLRHALRELADEIDRPSHTRASSERRDNRLARAKALLDPRAT